jgi:putative transposase
MEEDDEMVILTFHFPFDTGKRIPNASFMFKEALEIAKYAAVNKERRSRLSTKEVKYNYLPSAVVNQILRKYSNKTIKTPKNVHLIVPGQSIKFADSVITIKCLNLDIPWQSGRIVKKINQVEIHKDHIYLNVSVKVPVTYQRAKMIGVDLNTTHHMAVASDIHSGKVWKLEKSAMNIRKMYQNKRKKSQSENNWRVLKDMKHKERNIVRDRTHKLVNKIIDIAVANEADIAIEDLTHIRENTRKRSNKTTRRATNSWSFGQFRFIMEYKCKLREVSLHVVDPAYTSQMCSKCVHIGTRNRKNFHCRSCGHQDHADVNAAFCIARRALTYL